MAIIVGFRDEKFGEQNVAAVKNRRHASERVFSTAS
jgi:hypothetical protein